MELKIEYLPISALQPYEKNTRKHQKKDIDNIARSISKYGMCDAIGIWGDKNTIVEGHGRLLACKQLGMTEVPCVRLDHLTDEQRREYAIAHNATAELSEWDLDILPDELAELDLSDFEFDFGIEDEEEDNESENPKEEQEDFYTEKTNIPQYEPTGENVSLSDCVERQKYNEILIKINQSSVTEEEKMFLICAATRHYKFSYKKIAEYYAQASAEMQELMEQSALVLIDYNDAIKNGYFKLRNRLENLRNEE